VLEAFMLEGSTLEVFMLEGSTLEVFMLEGSMLEVFTLEGSTLEAFMLEGSAPEAFMLEPFKREVCIREGWRLVTERHAVWHIPRECMPGAYTTGSRECVLVPLWRLVGMAAGLARNMGRTEHW
jgi:hypothetical protein